MKKGFWTRLYIWIGRAVVLVAAFLLVAVCTFIWVGMQKNGQTLADLFQPRKQVVESYSGSDEGKLPTLEKPAPMAAPVPISGGKTKPVAYSAPTEKATAEEYGVCKSCQHFHDLSKSCADDAAFVNSTVKERVYTVKAPTKKAKAWKESQQKKLDENKSKEPKTVSWTTADNTPRGGRTVGAPRYGDMSQMSDLEKEAAYKARNERSLEKIRQEVQKLRNGEVTPKPKGAIQTAFEYLTGN